MPACNLGVRCHDLVAGKMLRNNLDLRDRYFRWDLDGVPMQVDIKIVRRIVTSRTMAEKAPNYATMLQQSTCLRAKTRVGFCFGDCQHQQAHTVTGYQAAKINPANSRKLPCVDS